MADQFILVFSGRLCNSLIALSTSQLMLWSHGECDFGVRGVVGFLYERASRFRPQLEKESASASTVMVAF